jgi:hypothetical protein
VTVPIAVNWLPEPAITIATPLALSTFVAVQFSKVIGIAELSVQGCVSKWLGHWRHQSSAYR